MALQTTLQAIRDAGVLAVAVVSRDGTVLAADLPPGVSRETFSIMCATIHGAGMTVSNEMRRSPPRRIALESSEGRILITEAGRRALVIFVLPTGETLDDGQVDRFLEQVARDTG